MDVDSINKCQRMLMFDQVENCSLVDVEKKKSAAWQTSTKKTAVVDADKIFFYYAMGHEKCCFEHEKCCFEHEKCRQHRPVEKSGWYKSAPIAAKF